MTWVREHSLDWFAVCGGIGFLIGAHAPRHWRGVPLIAGGAAVILGLILKAFGFDI